MISYKPFWKTLKRKKISTYSLIKDYGFSRGLIDNLKHDRSLTTYSINVILNKLNINIDEFLIYTPDKRIKEKV